MRYYVKLCSSKVLLIFLIFVLVVGRSFSQNNSTVKVEADSSSFYKLKILLPPNSHEKIPALNFKDTDLRDILRTVAIEYQTNIIIENNANKRISISLFDIEVFDAVKIISQDNGFEFNYDSLRFYVRNFPVKQLPPPTEPYPIVSYKNKKLSVSADNVDIKNFIKGMQEATSKNFLLTSGTNGRVTGSLHDIELNIGVKNILNNNGFTVKLKDSIYHISNFTAKSVNNGADQQSNFELIVVNDLISVNAVNTGINVVLEELSKKLNLQMVKLVIPNTNVTLKCDNVGVDKIFDYLFMGTNYTYKREGSVYLIGEKNAKNLEETILIKLKYLKAETLELPPSLTQMVTSTLSKEHNGFVYTGPKENLRNIREYIETVDNPVPQVLIEALVIDYNLDHLYEFGITAGIGDSATIARPNKYLPSVDVTVGGDKINKFLEDIGSVSLFGEQMNVAKLGVLPDNFYVNLKAMEQDGIANIKSRPILSTLNGHTASLKIGTVQHYVFTDIMPITSNMNTSFIEKEKIETIEAIISFEITPWVGPNNELTLEITPEFQNPVGKFSPDKHLIPAINTRTFSSTVRLKDGETIVLGGLIQETETSSENKVPILGDIPLLGALFTSVHEQKSKGELMIYITPKISYGDDYEYLYYNYANHD